MLGFRGSLKQMEPYPWVGRVCCRLYIFFGLGNDVFHVFGVESLTGFGEDLAFADVVDEVENMFGAGLCFTDFLVEGGGF